MGTIDNHSRSMDDIRRAVKYSRVKENRLLSMEKRILDLEKEILTLQELNQEYRRIG